MNATFDALKRMEIPRQIATRRGKKVSDVIAAREGSRGVKVEEATKEEKKA